MNKLNDKEELIAGKIVKSFINEKLDAYVELIEPAGNCTTYIRDGTNQVWGKERWFVRFARPEECPPETERGQIWTQMIVKDQYTHRYFHYMIDASWEAYRKNNKDLFREDGDYIPASGINDKSNIF